jgi:hypothetical protein
MIFSSFKDFKLANQMRTPTPQLSNHDSPHICLSDNFKESHYLFMSDIVYVHTFDYSQMIRLKKVEGE